MLQMIFGKTLRNGISNKTIRDITGMKKIKELLRDPRLQEFGRVEKLDEKRVLAKVKNFVIEVLKKKRQTKEKTKRGCTKRHVG